jgi:hypothetical protein
MSIFLEENQVPNNQCVRLAWEQTPSGSLLSQLFLEMCSIVSFKQSIDWLLKDPKKANYPSEFVYKHFERLMLAKQLHLVKTTDVTNEQAMAKFKLRI